MKKSFLILIFILISSVVSAASGLLLTSIQSSDYDELKRMAEAYSLESDLSENELRNNLIAYFGLSSEDTEKKVFEKSSSIRIDEADRMTAFDDIVIIEGNVSMAFTDGDECKSVKASRIVVNLAEKKLEASGNVVLEDSGEGKTFSGQVVCLDWDNLDVTVFDGISSTERKNARGSSVDLYATGDSISYSGDNGTVFFKNGVIATSDEDPYWSISAKKLSLMGSDLFVDNAVLRLGRVPVMYFPVFFYPGTTLSFNPAMGLSSTRGAFLNTTYEVYGKYPNLGKKSSGSSDQTDVSASVFALMNDNTNENTVRSGLYYISTDDVQLSELEKWADGSNSYLAVFADVYEKLGLVLGYDTYNSFLGGKFAITSYSAINFKTDSSAVDNHVRYVFDMNVKAKSDRINFSFSIPFMSDPSVKVDLLNRNTVFGIDSVLGKDQSFTSTYSNQSEYSWSADANGSWSEGNYRFSLDSLKAKINFRLYDDDNDGSYKSQVESASFPYVEISSSGTFFERKESSSTVRVEEYSNELAKQFAAEQARIEMPENMTENGDSDTTEDTTEDKTGETTRTEGDGDNEKPASESQGFVADFYDGPAVELESRTSASGSLKSGYTFRQSVESRYVENLQKDDFYTKISGTLFMNGSVPDSWFSFEETIKPGFNYSTDYSDGTVSTEVSDLSLKSVFEAKSTKIGLTYRLTNDIYDYSGKRNSSSETITKNFLEWDKKHVSEHSLEFRKTFYGITVSVKETFKPVTETLKPSVTYSRNGFSSGADISFEKPDDKFEKKTGNFNVGYSSRIFTFSLSNSYDFDTACSSRWDGYSLVQKANSKLFDDNLQLNESLTLKKKFIPETLTLSADYSLNIEKLTAKTSVSYSMKGEKFEADFLRVALNYSLKPVYFWKNRIGLDSSLVLAFTYDFDNPYSASFSSDFKLDFAVAEFTEISFSVSSSNKSFFKYYDDSGIISLKEMALDLLRSFDFAGDGRKSTSFNLNSYSFELVHDMRDWKLDIKSEGKISSSGGRNVWIPELTVSVQWVAIPELKTENTW